MKVILTETARIEMERDATESYPYECCGFLYGSDEDVRTITQAEPVNNTKEENKERRFEISPLAYIKAEEYADSNNLTLIGVYHSHPDHPAVPSEHDLVRAMPYFSYPIISVKKGKVAIIRSWRLSDQRQFEEEDLEIMEKVNLDKYLTT